MEIIKSNNFKIRYILLACLLFSFQFCFLLQAQKVRSGKSSIHISNIKAEEKSLSDAVQPLIKIISPDFGQKDKLKSNQSEITVIGKVTDIKKGINRIFVNSQESELKEDGLFVYKMLLKKGENKINIIAVDNEDNYYEKNLTIERLIESKLVTTRLNIAGEYYALLIGVDEYEDPVLMDLDNPVRDAQNLYNVLVSDYYFDKENVKLIKNAKRDDITDALDFFAERLTKNDNLLIFYAGHGWWDEKANVGYWLPSDARLSRKADWFRNSALCDYLKEIDSKHTLLIADACFGGAIFKTRSVSMEAPKAIQMLYDLPSRKAMTSGTLTVVPDRSAFVKYLIDRLSTNEGKYISSEQLFSSFRIAVINNSDVIPQYGEIRNVGDEGGDFIFIKKD
ncbi:MAG: caspase family protein [Bacteroidales bacterium]|nr:MAG: caspase family protein [Bacteroidales bacterium]